MKFLECVLKYTESAIRIFSRLGPLSLVVIFLLILGEIIGRNIFNFTIRGTLEISEYTMVVLAFAGLGYAQLSKRHVRVDFVVRHFSAKIQAVLQIFVLSLVASLYTSMSWQVAKVTYTAWVGKATHWAVEFYLPTWLPNLVALLGCIFLVISFLIQIVRNIIFLSTGRMIDS